MSSNAWINTSALWKILVVGLLAGAGLPALFAVGLRALSLPGTHQHGAASSDSSIGGSAGGMAAAAVCFAVVLAGVGYGVYYIVNG